MPKYRQYRNVAETVIPVKLSEGETYEQDLQGNLE